MTHIRDVYEPVLPGGTLMSRVEIYGSESVDGQRSGTPHMHLACDEMYFGLVGHGTVELITLDGFNRLPMSPGVAIVFTPGTIHRAINPDGDLEILVIMQNKGLPERGDVAICFPPPIMTDKHAYEDAMKVDCDVTAKSRRDMGVSGFLELKKAFSRSLDEGREALDRFYQAAVERTRDQYPGWEKIVADGPAEQVRRTQQTLKKLSGNSIESLQEGQFLKVETASCPSFGFCGHIHSYQPPATSRFTPEGVRSR